MVRESELERIKAKALERKAQTKKEARCVLWCRTLRVDLVLTDKRISRRQSSEQYSTRLTR